MSALNKPCDCDDELHGISGLNPEDSSTYWICRGCGHEWERE